jgi:hypothetical protein
MPDMSYHDRNKPISIEHALQSLPLQTPSRSALPALQAVFNQRKAKTKRMWPLAIAASAAAALLIGALIQNQPASIRDVSDIAALQAQSRQLQSLWQASRNESGDATYLMLSMQLEDELAALDQNLRDPRLNAQQRQQLWQQRVQTLQTAASFETTRDWLNANGQPYNTSLVMTD